MNEDDIVELLEKLGYDGARREVMVAYIREWERRKALVMAGPISALDVVNASFIFDALNRKKKEK